MRILIVDDEFLVRMGIRHSLSKRGKEFVIAGEAADGEEAIRMTLELRPDIVLLDINMPVMNGIEVLERFRKLGVKAEVVILSCHDEFEYVKQGMKLGAYDYLLKHTLANDKLYEILEQLKQIIQGRRQNEEFDSIIYEHIGEVREIVRYEYLTDLIHGKKRTEHIPVHPAFDERQFVCIICIIENYEEIKSRYNENERENFISSFILLVKQVLKKNEKVELFFYKDDQMVMFVTPDAFTELQKIEWCRNTASSVIFLIKKYMEISIFVGISREKNSLKDVQAAYYEASVALLSKFVDYHQDIFVYNYTREQEKEALVSEYALTLERYIREAAIKREYNKADELLAEYLVYMKELKFVNRPGLVDFIVSIIHIIQTSENSEIKQPEEEIRMASCIEEIGIYLKEFFSLLKNQDSCNSYFTSGAAKFIKEHYFENISLKSLADYFELSESYVSRLFGKSMGMSFSAYLNGVRVEHAKELLLNSNRKAYEIAEECGFNSVINFNIVFKRMEGISPMEYKNSKNLKKM